MIAGFDQVRLDRVAETLTRDITAGRIHGAAMRVSRAGSVVLDFLGGYSDKAAGRQLAENSVFPALSISKLFTSVLALGLVERGLLRMHTPVADVIPEFGRFGKEKVTLFHLLTHTSGGMRGRPVDSETMFSIEKLTEYACALPLDFRSGEGVSYSLLIAHTVVAAMCLRVDGNGRSFKAMLEDDLFRPLGMMDTSLGYREDLNTRICPLRAAQHVPTIFGAAIDYLDQRGLAEMLQPGAEWPGAGCLTTLNDSHRFIEMLRRGGELDGARMLSPAMIEFCSRNHTGTMIDAAWDSILPVRNWAPFPANLGVGVDVRGDDPVRPGPFGMLNSPQTFGRFGAGSTGIWVDPRYQVSYTLLTTGLLEETYNMERTALLSDLVISAIVDQ